MGTRNMRMIRELAYALYNRKYSLRRIENCVENEILSIEN